MQTIVELPEFQRRSLDLLKEEEKTSIINYLAAHPMAGDLMQGTGGIRKLRWSALGKGKSGGVRVIYYFHNGAMPLFLLTLFGKGEKANLSKAERNQLARFTTLLVKHYGDVNE
ncbi:type II toxin-antitoxin system RelE/ParE family toxin [Parathalassolituus penaei]|uniref:Type II toxin-antitoxin system RelE/ParE family toxin n=1 Tax=Parathalassolituus penaei TaxID=2997323 RepID=A0A9X3ITG0_9GAMM|nr:type II toxin-antitoxin system RelE/ParE family toxin [Parathalassolituus penaei]MCY0967447.1 type II toxin-antitoxin system RelE/ParE family toxin [Parathalassolituus penaei]